MWAVDDELPMGRESGPSLFWRSALLAIAQTIVTVMSVSTAMITPPDW